MATATKIKGRKGGSSSSRTPVEQPDDLQSIAKAKLLIALGEGEFGGGLTGQSIFLDGTPLLNSDGSSNFSGVAWEFRAGTQAQSYIQGLPGTENEISVGTEVKSAVAWTHTFTNTQLSAIRLRLKWPSLFKQEDDGDLVGYSINYTIEMQTDGGAFQTVVNTAVTGKTTSGYERSHRIDLPQAGSTWTIRLRKITTDANSAKIGDAMTIQSYTEVIDAKLRYPNTALLYIEFDSSQFNGSIPQISCEPQGRVIRVPDNYDPITRTYSGTWTGAFKWAWSDNPAWIFYDVVVTDRFGLGNRLTAANIDKWELYQVSQYCDQMVPDGKGGSGTEPRYVCNVYVQSRNDAYTVLRDFAAIFRGMTYWGGNQIVALADMPRDIDYSYTRANVIDGQFSYSSSTTKTRYTTALVSWSDPDNAYADAMEPVFEQDLVTRYGFNQLELTAIGCTRQSEANRKGRWGIMTNNKDRVITFSVGLDGMIPQPGYIIAVADEMLSGKVTGGRISSVNGRAITLDRVPDAVAGGRLILNLPSGAAQTRTIQSASGKVVTVTAAYGETPEAESVWVVESDELYAQQYRVLSVADNNDNTFTISAAYHDPDKYARIDTGAIIDERPISVIPPGSQSAPANIQIGSFSVVNQGISVQTMRATWDTTANAIAYEAQWRRNDGNWVNVPRSSTTSFEVPGIYAGRYLVRVRAINAAEISSGWGYSEEITLTGKEGNPPKPVGFAATDNVVFGIELNWGFPENTGDTLKTEIQYSTTPAGDDPMLLSDVPYPQRKYQQLGLRAGQTFWYRAQLVDKTGNESGYTDWVMGQASTDAEAILSYLTGKINETQLAQDLLTKINNAITEEELADIRGDIGETKGRLGSIAEGVLNNVIAIRDNDELIHQLSAQTGQNVATIFQKLQVLTTADSAFAQQLDVIGVQMAGNTAAITTEQTARAEADDALSSRITLLNASVGDNRAAILAEQTARADGDSANAQAITDLSTTVGQNTAQITNLSEVVSDISGSVATQLEGVNASNHNNAEANLFQAVSEVLADASVTSLTKVVANNDIASAQKIETLTAQVNDTKAQVQTTASAVTTLSGKVTASYNIKVGVTSGGLITEQGWLLVLVMKQEPCSHRYSLPQTVSRFSLAQREARAARWRHLLWMVDR
ncbi:host specificity protein J [Rahnella sp. PCH160]|uniref:host specificity protein J n=1 Tax=Rahnella sp. PCH160 TaxID=3447928 RepID=UPI0039FB9CA6